MFGLQEIEPVGGQRSRSVTITQAGTTELVDFVASIELTDADLRTFARPDGRDIHFTDLAGAELPFELVSYSSGSLEAWVRVTLARSVTIKMRYGGEPIPPDPTSAWSPLFAAVWHFSETAGGAMDSTSHTYHLVPEDVMDPPTSAAGIAGNGRAFVDAAISERLCASPARVFDQGTRPFSYSVWIRPGLLAGTYDQPFCAGGLTDGQPGFSIELTTTTTSIELSDTVAHTELELGAASGWAHRVGVIDRVASEVRMYTNGIEVAAPLTLAGNIVSTLPICMGGPNGYTGLLDEVRVYTDALSSDWVRAEYDNLTRRADFILVGDPD